MQRDLQICTYFYMDNYCYHHILYILVYPTPFCWGLCLGRGHAWFGCFLKWWYPKMDGENNGSPYWETPLFLETPIWMLNFFLGDVFTCDLWPYWCLLVFLARVSKSMCNKPPRDTLCWKSLKVFHLIRSFQTSCRFPGNMPALQDIIELMTLRDRSHR